MTDLDFYSPGGEITIDMGFSVKRISSNRMGVDFCEVRVAPAEAATPRAAWNTGRTLDPEVAILTISESTSMVNFKVRKDLSIGRGQGIVLGLKYAVPLAGNGDGLLFCGSVQPSDYQGVRDKLRLGDISKKVRLRVTSDSFFETRHYCGSVPVAFPVPRPALQSGERDDDASFEAVIDLEVDFGDWHRAWYFGLSALARREKSLESRHGV
ncbi:MAG: hypothetical protein R3325_05850 [Thermoanaerobaculia bacterium]|nr:hypothetical protein [Thermoanaerobaculia bacterium]